MTISQGTEEQLWYILKEYYPAIKDLTTDLHNNVDESQIHYVKLKKSASKTIYYVNPIYDILQEGKSMGKENGSVFARDWERGSRIPSGIKESLGVIELSCVLTVMSVSQMHSFVKTYKTVVKTKQLAPK